MSRPVLTSGSYWLLTTKPQTRRFNMSDPEFLYVYPREDKAAARLYYEITQDDSSQVVNSISLGDLRRGETKIVDISQDVEDYEGQKGAGRTIKSIKFYVHTSQTATPEDYIVAIPWTPTSKDRTAIYYANSYGGWDSLVCEGESQGNIENDQITSRRILPINYNIQLNPQVLLQDSRGMQVFTFTTGKMPRLEREALRDMALKKQLAIYSVINQTKVKLPAIFDESSMPLASSFSNITNLAFSLRFAWEAKALDRVES